MLDNFGIERVEKFVDERMEFLEQIDEILPRSSSKQMMEDLVDWFSDPALVGYGIIYYLKKLK
jgi:hypothetical protein